MKTTSNIKDSNINISGQNLNTLVVYQSQLEFHGLYYTY